MPEARINASCEWKGDAVVIDALDPRERQSHLAEDARDRETDTFAYDESHDPHPSGAEGETHPELVPALRDVVADHAVQSDRG